MDPREALPGFEDRAPKDRYCDLVLTGGVTSAIAYPPVAFGLGEVYRFNAIGGASSGAGIAAVTAAAEYRRRHGSSEGFDVLVRRTEALATDTAGHRNLSRLFQPLPEHARLYRAVLGAVASPKGWIRKLATDLAIAYVWQLLLGLALFLSGLLLVCMGCSAQDGFASVWLGVFVAAGSVCAAVASVASAVWVDLKGLANDDYGLCDGLSQNPRESHPPLTVWLHNLIQEAAGRAADGPPLTFADLHTAPGSPRETLGDRSTSGATSIRLEIVASNMTLGEPVRFPREKINEPLYFRPAEMRRLFPASVVAHLMANSCAYGGTATVVEPSRPPRPGSASPMPEDLQLRCLPLDKLPIVFAARMSISFPVLFTAVPLWREDTGHLRRCLMVDGGLCSNFPIHLFDSFVPAWPTFGVSLYDLPETAQDQSECCKYEGNPLTKKVKLPTLHRDNMAPRWNGFDELADVHDRIVGLLGAMLGTIKDWSDAKLARMPGVRDRVVRVGLAPGIGGLNLLMTEAQIRCLADQGKEAVRQLLARFARPDLPSGQARGWDEHRWVRFNLLCKSLADGLAGLTRAAESSRYVTPLRELIERATEQTPLVQAKEDGTPPAGPLRSDQGAALEGALAALMQAEQALSAVRVAQPYQPYPPQDLRVRPPM